MKPDTSATEPSAAANPSAGDDPSAVRPAPAAGAAGSSGAGVDLGPLGPLFEDDEITDILVNGPEEVFVERAGRLEPAEVRFRDRGHLAEVVERIVAQTGRRIDRGVPLADAHLPDGSRVNATLAPATVDGPTISIRRFGRKRLRIDQLIERGMLSEEMWAFLEAAVRARLNIVVSGGTGAGKSTLLSAICRAIPADQRLVTIEDAAELDLDQGHVVRMETRPPNTDDGEPLSTRDLVVNALRMRPDRIIVGEVRAGEALDMLQAMSTGHDGSLTTIHASSPRDAIARLETMVLMAGTDLPSAAIRRQIVSAVHLIVHVRRYEDGARRAESITELVRLEGDTPVTQEIFACQPPGEPRSDGDAASFVAKNIVPRAVETLRARGEDVDVSMFRSGGGGS